MAALGSRRGVVPMLALLAVVIAALWLSGGLSGSDSTPDPDSVSSGPTSSTSVDSTSVDSASTDPASGLTFVEVGDLPPEARRTLALIDAGGPYPYPGRDDVTFRNDQGLLPDEDRGYYREYTVTTPGSRDRGARRVVAGDAGELYYTDDHYGSFERIRR